MTKIKECYFYKNDNKYHLHLRDDRNRFLNKVHFFENKTELTQFLDILVKNEHAKFSIVESKFRIYNKKPMLENILVNAPKSIFLEKLSSSVKLENTDKVANFLRSLSDLLTTQPNDLVVAEPENVTAEIIPDEKAPISDTVPQFIIDLFEEQLSIKFADYINLTFYFQKEKFQLTKALFDFDTPKMDKPNIAPSVVSAVSYMTSLLGVNADIINTPEEYSFTFPMDEEIYKVKHIYTGSGISFARKDEK